MPNAPYEKDSAGMTFEKGLELAAMVNAEAEVSFMARESFDSLDFLKNSSVRRRGAKDRLLIARGPVNAATRRTNRTLASYAKSLAGATGSLRMKGERTPEYRFVMNGKTPATLLAVGRIARTRELELLGERIKDGGRAGPAALQLAPALLAAMETELAAVRSYEETRAAYALELEQEEAAKLRAIAAVRGMINNIQAYFRERPADAREVLGHVNPAAAKKSRAAKAGGAGEMVAA